MYQHLINYSYIWDRLFLHLLSADSVNTICMNVIPSTPPYFFRAYTLSNKIFFFYIRWFQIWITCRFNIVYVMLNNEAVRNRTPENPFSYSKERMMATQEGINENLIYGI